MLEILTDNFKIIIDNHTQGLELTRFWANATTHLTDCRFHADKRQKGCKSIIYYVNSNWESDWGGETLFKNKEDVLERAMKAKKPQGKKLKRNNKYDSNGNYIYSLKTGNSSTNSTYNINPCVDPYNYLYLCTSTYTYMVSHEIVDDQC